MSQYQCLLMCGLFPIMHLDYASVCWVNLVWFVASTLSYFENSVPNTFAAQQSVHRRFVHVLRKYLCE